MRNERPQTHKNPARFLPRLALVSAVLGAALLLAASPATSLSTGFLVKHTVDQAFNGAVAVHAADIDGDGDLDVLGAAREADAISWWENTTGDGRSWFEHLVERYFDGATAVYAADIDGDRDMDLLGASNAQMGISWWENKNGKGTSWSPHPIDTTFNLARSVYAADLDGDLDLDVLGAAYRDGEITWWENWTGRGTTWVEHTVSGSFNGAMAVHAADLDGDGDLDVLGAARIANDITWWQNTTGDGTAWVTHVVDRDFDGAYAVHAADVDGDRDLDIIGAAHRGDSVTWWENTTGGGSAWRAHLVDSEVGGPRSVYAADVDGDGDMDILGAASEPGVITWWENGLGNGTTWAEHPVSTSFNAAYAVYAADVDGDDDPDVLGAAYDDDEVAWWENQDVISQYLPLLIK